MNSRVTADQEMRQFNVKLAPEGSEFVQDVLRPQLGLPYNNGEAAPRTECSAPHTWFYLPVPAVRALEQDAELHKVHILGVPIDASSQALRVARSTPLRHADVVLELLR